MSAVEVAALPPDPGCDRPRGSAAPAILEFVNSFELRIDHQHQVTSFTASRSGLS